MVDFWVGRVGDLHLRDSVVSFELFASSTLRLSIGNHCVFPLRANRAPVRADAELCFHQNLAHAMSDLARELGGSGRPRRDGFAVRMQVIRKLHSSLIQITMKSLKSMKMKALEVRLFGIPSLSLFGKLLIDFLRRFAFHPFMSPSINSGPEPAERLPALHGEIPAFRHLN